MSGHPPWPLQIHTSYWYIGWVFLMKALQRPVSLEQILRRNLQRSRCTGDVITWGTFRWQEGWCFFFFWEEGFKMWLENIMHMYIIYSIWLYKLDFIMLYMMRCCEMMASSKVLVFWGQLQTSVGWLSEQFRLFVDKKLLFAKWAVEGPPILALLCLPPHKWTCPQRRNHFKRKFHLPTIDFQRTC